MTEQTDKAETVKREADEHVAQEVGASEDRMLARMGTTVQSLEARTAECRVASASQLAELQEIRAAQARSAQFEKHNGQAMSALRDSMEDLRESRKNHDAKFVGLDTSIAATFALLKDILAELKGVRHDFAKVFINAAADMMNANQKKDGD